MSRMCQVLRVFTRGSEGGNHLGVINDSMGLSDELMQDIARDLGFSETVFVSWPPGEIPFVRIFSPGMELPFAGHPLVGTTWSMLAMGPGGVDRIRCGIGEVEVGMDGDEAWIATPIDPANATPENRDDYAARAGMPQPVGAYLVRIPKDYVILEYADIATVAAVAPEAEVLAEQFGTLVYARQDDQVRARFFAPDAGVYEDSATGSAAVALATALVASGEETGAVSIDQGEEMGYPSRIALSWTPTAARIGGTCVREDVRTLAV